eukprot:6336656-Amphidinium_carterae.1
MSPEHPQRSFYSHNGVLGGPDSPGRRSLGAIHKWLGNVTHSMKYKTQTSGTASPLDEMFSTLCFSAFFDGRKIACEAWTPICYCCKLQDLTTYPFLWPRTCALLEAGRAVRFAGAAQLLGETSLGSWRQRLKCLQELVVGVIVPQDETAELQRCTAGTQVRTFAVAVAKELHWPVEDGLPPV